MDTSEVLKNHDSESSDSDIFIIKQIKPVSRITLPEALIIKHSVLNPAKSRNKVKNKKVKNGVPDLKRLNKKEKKCRHQEKHPPGKPRNLNEETSTKILNSDKKPKEDNRKVNLCKTVKRNSSGEIKQEKPDNQKTSPDKTTHYLLGYSSKKPEKNEEDFKNVQLSPGVSKRRKKFKISDDALITASSGNPAKKSLVKKFDVVEDIGNSSPDIFKLINVSIEFESFCESEFESSFTDVLNSVEILDRESFENNSELLSFLLKKIIHNEMKKQTEMEKTPVNGIKPEKLLLKNEEEILKKFLYLNKNCSNVLVRMLCRKKDWHRVSTLNLKDIKSHTREFNILYKEKFVDINIGNENVRTQMNLLKRSEILQLCKKFNVFFKFGNPNKKQNLINSLIESSTKQRSVYDMFSNKTNCNSRLNLLKLEVKCCLGPCVKLSKNMLSAFNKIMVLFSFAHYDDDDDEDKRFSNQLFMCLKVFKHMMKFPSYKLSPCVVFETRDDLEEYEKALKLQNDFEIAKVNKQFDNFTEIANQAEVCFRRLLNDKGCMKRFHRLKPFLKRFSAGTIYAKILTSYCSSFKRQSNNTKIISVVKLLLQQDTFLHRKRGEWYKNLSKALENQREMNAASEVLITGLNDPFLNEVQKLALQLRGQLILKRKSSGVDDVKLREELDYACTVEVQQPPSIEIMGRAVQGNEPGYKCTYIEHNDSGKVFSSVEERAISYYKSNGYTHGLHVEGFIVHSMYFLFFYDVIYELSPVGVFLTPYQHAPLDFYSPFFYTNRKDEIDLLFAQMLSWSDVEIEAKLNEVYSRNVNTTCVVNWREGFTPDLFCEILKCLTMPLFVSICRRLVTNFGAMRAGFPDLTLWNTETKKCKFVEVKSPNDKLSPAQRVWLDFLRNIGIDCEVCNVKNSGKKLKS